MKKGDLLLFFGFLLIIAAMFMFACNYYITNVNVCTSDPLKYAVEEIRENYNASHVYGNIYVTTPKGQKTWDYGDASNINLSFLE